MKRSKFINKQKTNRTIVHFFSLSDQPRSEDISIVHRSEKNEMIQVAIWKAYPKPTCHIFVGVSKLSQRIHTVNGLLR